MKIINLTPHAITVEFLAGGRRTFEPDGRVCRCTTGSKTLDPLPADRADGSVVGVPLSEVVMDELQGLPDPQEGVVYLVSTPAAQKAASIGRRDVVSPNTGPEAVRNDKGQVVAVRGFQRF